MNSGSEKKKFCSNCGKQLEMNAKFCNECGAKIETDDKRKMVFEGQIHQCPNCGEPLKAFELSCPACGLELREKEASSAIKEFVLKLETIESLKQRTRKTNDQKINLIKSFSVPNSKEDMLEFMILATSNIDLSAYDLLPKDISKNQVEINAAWLSKAKQVYEKAKLSYSADNTLVEIKNLYDDCAEKIKKAKQKRTVKNLILWTIAAICFIIFLVVLGMAGKDSESKALKQLENLETEVQDALDKGEYKHALLIADSIDYQGYNVDLEKKYDIQREYWVDKVLTEAEKNGLNLEYTPTEDIDKAND